MCGKHEQRERVEAGFKPPLYVERVVSGIVRPAKVTKNVTNSAASLLIRDTTVSQCRHNLVVSLSSGGVWGSSNERRELGSAALPHAYASVVGLYGG